MIHKLSITRTVFEVTNNNRNRPLLSISSIESGAGRGLLRGQTHSIEAASVEGEGSTLRIRHSIEIPATTLVLAGGLNLKDALKFQYSDENLLIAVPWTQK